MLCPPAAPATEKKEIFASTIKGEMTRGLKWVSLNSQYITTND